MLTSWQKILLPDAAAASALTYCTLHTMGCLHCDCTVHSSWAAMIAYLTVGIAKLLPSVTACRSQSTSTPTRSDQQHVLYSYTYSATVCSVNWR